MPEIWVKLKSILSKYLKIFTPRSIKYRLLVMFCLVSIVPMLIVNIVSYLNISEIVENNIADYTRENLSQTNKSIETVINSYEDLLYQLYTDDSIIELIYKINGKTNLAVSKNQLRRKLRGLSYAKPYITSISIILDNGQTIFYDKLTASILKTSWMDNYKVSKNKLYKQISSTNSTQILATEYASEYNSHKYFLFHLGHRIIDYRNIKKDIGVVILSIDERMLKELLNKNNQQEENFSSINLLIDKNGLLLSSKNDRFLGKVVTTANHINRDNIMGFLKKSQALSGRYLDINSFYNQELGWRIVNISNQRVLKDQLSDQFKNTLIIIAISFIILLVIVILSTNHFTKSINKLVKAMKNVEQGELDSRVKINSKMPLEIEVIASNFNRMLTQIKTLIDKVKDITNKKKDAEIRALEAQINPHFLYNTLDTINWMAIDKEDYEISNAISALAKILRYGINMSNETVNLMAEIEWLKKYVFLQQTRLKSSFEFEIEIQKEAEKLSIHKLLFQPFVENALLHGYKDEQNNFRLLIKITIENNNLKIMIKDNGRGIADHELQEIRQMINFTNRSKNKIGIMNAVERVKLYYGNNAKIKIESELDFGTSIYLYLPLESDF